MLKDIQIHKADSNEIKTFVQKLVEKCIWLNNQDIPTWNINSLTVDKLNKQYSNPEYFVCYIDNHIIGGFILIDQDNSFWPEIKENNAYYIHKLLVCNGFNGNGYGNQIMEWIKEYGKKNGKEHLRLDYFKSKQKLKQFYDQNGFYDVGEMPYKNIDINIKAQCTLTN